MESPRKLEIDQKEADNMEPKAFEPILADNESYTNLSSYNITALFALALLGGITPNVIYSLKNAKKLKLEARQRRKMRVLGLLLWFCELLSLSICLRFENLNAGIQVALFSRLASVVIYVYFYVLMRPKYKVVKFFEGKLDSTVPIIICWAVIGYKVELLMAFIGGTIISYF